MKKEKCEFLDSESSQFDNFRQWTRRLFLLSLIAQAAAAVRTVEAAASFYTWQPEKELSPLRGGGAHTNQP